MRPVGFHGRYGLAGRRYGELTSYDDGWPPVARVDANGRRGNADGVPVRTVRVGVMLAKSPRPAYSTSVRATTWPGRASPCKSSDAFRLHVQWGVAQCYSCGGKWSPFQLAEVVTGDREQAKSLLVELGLFKPSAGRERERRLLPTPSR